jgi:hypothetical protein
MGIEPPGRDRKRTAERWIPQALWAATGASFTLWLAAQFNSGPARADDPIWLAIILTLTAWPSYLAWRYCSRVRDEVAGVNRGRAYREGWADGYLAGAADRFRDDGDAPERRRN